jgi:superfamily II DNA/RNA helicase
MCRCWLPVPLPVVTAKPDALERELDRGVDVVIGTPGRIIDLIDRGTLDISQIQSVSAFCLKKLRHTQPSTCVEGHSHAPSLTYTRHIVLDEADRMLDMGFSEDIGGCNWLCQLCFFSSA